MRKLAFVIGLGLGYVLGARAGKQRYEQLKSQAGRVWESPTVQHRVGDVAQQVKDRAPAAKSAATTVAAKAAHKVGLKDEPADAGLPDTAPDGTDGMLQPDGSEHAPDVEPGGQRLP